MQKTSSDTFGEGHSVNKSSIGPFRVSEKSQSAFKAKLEGCRKPFGNRLRKTWCQDLLGISMMRYNPP